MKKILVINNTLHVLDEVRDILEMEGFIVLTAFNATAGWALVPAKDPDLVVTDLYIPKIDGFGFINCLKADATLSDLTVVAFSAKVDPNTHKRAKDLGIHTYVKNPCSSEELISSISQNLI
ncbi:MAG: response regulator [Bacteroidota bacterium]